MKNPKAGDKVRDNFFAQKGLVLEVHFTSETCLVEWASRARTWEYPRDLTRLKPKPKPQPTAPRRVVLEKSLFAFTTTGLLVLNAQEYRALSIFRGKKVRVTVEGLDL